MNILEDVEDEFDKPNGDAIPASKPKLIVKYQNDGLEKIKDKRKKKKRKYK